MALSTPSDPPMLRQSFALLALAITVAYGTQPVSSADSRWVAYLVGVSPKERDRMAKEKKPVRTASSSR